MERPIRKEAGQLAFRSAQGRNKIDAAPFASARERDVATVRRPDRIEVGGGIGRQPQRFPSVNQLDENVLIVLLFAIPDESDLVSVRRKRRLAFTARKTGDGNDLRLRSGAFALGPGDEFVQSEANPANRNDQRRNRQERAFSMAPDLADQSLWPRFYFSVTRRRIVDLRLLLAHLPHSGHKSVAAPRHGFDKPLPILAIAQRLADERDVGGKVCFLDKGIRPDQLQ